jgi:hypothetical protein
MGKFLAIPRQAALAAVVAISLFSASARADLVVTVQEDAGPVGTVVNVVGSPSSDLVGTANSATTADYAVKFISGEAFQQSSASSFLADGTFSVKNTTGHLGHILHLVINGTGYTAPVTPPDINVASGVGGSVTQTHGTNTLTFQSFVNGVGLGAQTPSITSVASFNNTLNSVIHSLSGPYAIKETIDIKLNGKNDQIGINGTTILQSVPEPSSLVLGFIGVLGLAGYGLRRRMTRGA